jgi:uncharacterized protein (DUF433 family)
MAGLLARITVDPHVCGGQPCVRGLRIPVALVLRHLAAGQTPQQIAEEYPELTPDDVLELGGAHSRSDVRMRATGKVGDCAPTEREGAALDDEALP